ncbi:MAG: ABC transporter ATP-binding protein [bacterium]
MSRHSHFYSDEDIDKSYDIKLLNRFFAYLAPYKWTFWFAVFISLISTAVALVLPHITKIAIDKYIMVGDFEGLKKLVFIYAAFLFAGGLSSWGMNYSIAFTAQSVIRDIRVALFSHLQKLKIKFFDLNPVGRLVTRVTNDEEALNDMISNVGATIFANIFTVIGAIWLMLQLDVKVSLITFLVIPPLVISLNLFRIRAKKAYRTVRKWLAQINVLLSEYFEGMKTTKLFNREQENCHKFTAVNKEYYNSNMKQVIVYGTFMPITELLLSVGTALIIWWGGGEALQSKITIGTLVAFTSYIRLLFQPIIDFSHKLDTVQSSLAAAERIFLLMDTKDFEYDDEKAVSQHLKTKGEIEFKNVWFSYEDTPNPENWVLKDINLRIKPGERIAVVGPTGAGKTSIIGLIVKFYTPQKGEILIDGIPIQNIKHAELRSKLALVTQDSYIFSGTIRDNIKLRDSKVTEEEIQRAAEITNVTKFIDKMPGKYDEEIKERGTNLSSGERQLLTFARAIAVNPSILILDEATREVDSLTEGLIQDATHKLLENRTAIVVAHRLSTIKNVDRIIVISDGKIIENGTHEELIKNDGFYAVLYNLQYT